MKSNTDKKVVIITGGGSGIGRATALEMAQRGYAVIIADIDEYGANKTTSKILESEGDAVAVRLDVTNQSAVAHMMDNVHKEYGQINCLVNNAGIGGDLNFMESYDDATFHQVINVNLFGVWYCTKAVLPYMRKQKYGAIVNVSSVAGTGGAPRMSGYSASKHAVVGLTKTVAQEYGKYNIRINAVCPTVIDTPMGRSYLSDDDQTAEIIRKTIPMKRFGEPFEVAQAIMWLCSDQASFVNGQTVAIDGGFSA